MEKLVIGVLGAILGFASGLIAPWVKWHIEKQKIKQHDQRDLLKRCRDKIREQVDEPAEFLHSVEYSEVRVHFPEAAVENLEAKYGVASASTSRTNTFENKVLDALADLEKEWGLR